MHFFNLFIFKLRMDHGIKIWDNGVQLLNGSLKFDGRVQAQEYSINGLDQEYTIKKPN
jgi:hypothetical protein